MHKSAETALQAEPRRIQRLEVALCPARRRDPAPHRARDQLGPPTRPAPASHPRKLSVPLEASK